MVEFYVIEYFPSLRTSEFFSFISRGEVELSPLLLRPLNGLLYQLVMMIVEQYGAIIGKGNRSDVLGENLPHSRLVNHKSHMT
jgi:hypothetical protein